MRTTRAVLFDFGGVLAEEGFSEGLEALRGEQHLPVADMTQAGMHAVYDSGYVTGQGTEADFWNLLRERTGLRGDDAALTKNILDGFVVRPWMLELVQRLRSLGYLTGILSDQTDWLDRLDAGQHFYRCFDRVYNSYRLGKGKQDPSVFSDVAADLGVAPQQILFIDDNEHNVERARSAGMHAIHYRDRKGFLDELDRWLLAG
jgi:putative hydrolase of the HAD superfamily